MTESMSVDFSPLPIEAALPELRTALRASNAAVLVAPPGAGKTTRVPLALADEEWAQKSGKPGRTLVLEPRRLAARAAAERMARTFGERVGETVGLRVRFGSKVSQDPHRDRHRGDFYPAPDRRPHAGGSLRRPVR
jgi:ATP-dependent helicase HrpB